MRCCGIYGSEDWRTFIPQSCCIDYKCMIKHNTGCIHKIHRLIAEQSITYTYSALFCAFIQVRKIIIIYIIS